LEIVTTVITTLVAIIGWFISKNVSQMEGDLKEIRTKVFKIHINTQESLAVINEKLSGIQDDLRSFSVAADKLKNEIQTLHVRNAKQTGDTKKADETFGKVILLEDKFEKLQSATKSVLSELRNKKTHG